MVRWSSQMTVFSTRTSQWGEEQNLLTMMRIVMRMISHDWQVSQLLVEKPFKSKNLSEDVLQL